MRTGISIEVSPSDHLRLEALVRDRNTAQKHVWRAEIVLLSAAGIGTVEIMADGQVEDLSSAKAPRVAML